MPPPGPAVEPLFQALCEAAALNPDTDDGDDAAGDFFFNEDEVLANPEARAQLLAAQERNCCARL